jgi:hypothetical protein
MQLTAAALFWDAFSSAFQVIVATRTARRALLPQLPEVSQRRGLNE